MACHPICEPHGPLEWSRQWHLKMRGVIEISLKHGPIYYMYHISYRTVVTDVEHRPEFQLTINTTYLTLTGTLFYKYFSLHTHFITLQWCHNECKGMWNHPRLDCSLNCLSMQAQNKPSKLGVTGLCEGNPLVTSGFPSQRASNAENVSILWCHHDPLWPSDMMSKTLVITASGNGFSTSSMPSHFLHEQMLTFCQLNP